MANCNIFQGLTHLTGSQLSRHYSATGCVYRLLLCCLSMMVWSVSAAQPCQDLTQLHWLNGAWQQQTSTKRIQESWSTVSPQSMEGISTTRTFADDKLKSHFEEHLRLVQMLDGVFFIAKVPQNTLPVAFKATTCQNNDVVFENANHDFPQRLHYKMQEGRLHIRVENFEGKGFELLMQKVND